MANGCNIPLEVEGISPMALDVDSPDAMALDVGMTINQSAGGAVNSVNGKTGNVVLDASDVGALPDTTAIPSKTSDLTNDSGFVNASGAASAAPVQSVNGKTGAVVLSASDVGAGTYSKPSGGIPKTDLASAVQTSLGKADSALQSVPSTYRTAAAQDTIDAGKITAPSSPAVGDTLVWDGTDWVAQAVSPGGGGETWITICDMTLTEDVQSIKLTTDANGNPFNLRKIAIIAKFESAAVKGAWMKILTTSNQYRSLLPIGSFSFPDAASNKHTNMLAEYEFCGLFWLPSFYSGSNRTDNYCIGQNGSTNTGGDGFPLSPTTTINLLELYANNAAFGAGSTIKIMGVSA